VLLAQPVAAQKPVSWKWRSDDTFYARTTTRVKQSIIIEDPTASVARAASYLSTLTVPVQLMSIDGMMSYSPPLMLKDRELKQEYEHVSWIQYTVKQRNDNGTAVVSQQVVKDYGEIRTADTVKIDSTLNDVELTLTVDSRGIVSEVRGGEKLLDKLAGNDTGKGEALKEALLPETLKASATQALGVMPPREVKDGDTWDMPGELKLGALGRVKLTRSFTLDGFTERGVTKLARISFTTKLSEYQPARAGGNAFRIADGAITHGEGKGSLEVDLDAGRLREAKAEVSLRGHLTLVNTNIQYRARLVQDQTVTLTVLDRLPPKEEPK
jgi:hypothetical protein